MKNPRDSRRKEILKIRAEINAKETKETIAEIDKAKSWFFERINKLTNHQPDSSRNKGRKIKSIKSEMKMERSQQTTVKDYARKQDRSYKRTGGKKKTLHRILPILKRSFLIRIKYFILL